jgi:1-aminocyclopropane-1-carboxylate deaminase/D-cysteine desulfhydrase-like pyridoxal-dependent ACC family enzyme
MANRHQISRRKFIGLATVGTAGAFALPAGYVLTGKHGETFRPLTVNDQQLRNLPGSYTPSAPAIPALIERYPQLHPSKPGNGLRIADPLSMNGEFTDFVMHGEPGQACFSDASTPGRRLLPRVELFPRRRQSIETAPDDLHKAAGCRLLLVKDDGSSEHALYGNKARKYEFLLANLALSRTRQLLTAGTGSSNHAMQLAIANRLAAVRPDHRPLDAKLGICLLSNVQEAGDHWRWRLMRELGATLEVVGDQTDFALSYARDMLAATSDEQTAFIPPGGSSPLTALGHFDALLEVDREMKSGNSPLESPPDYLFAAIGSGSTVLGMLLGIHALGWPTKVIAVASQNRGPLERLVVNQRPDLPFITGNLRNLTSETLAWLRHIGFPQSFPDMETLLQRHLIIDSDSWHPAYGRLSDETEAIKKHALENGLTLDDTFTAKTLSSLLRSGRNRLLKGKSVLFWNTCNRFDYRNMLV